MSTSTDDRNANMYSFGFVYHSTRKFNFHPDLNEFTAEVSTLCEGNKKPAFGRIYNDAADTGFILVSHVTLQDVKFYIDREEKNSEGELIAWHLKPEDAAICKHPKLKDVTIVVFND